MAGATMASERCVTVGITFHPAFIAALDDWACEVGGTRSGVLRRLAERGFAEAVARDPEKRERYRGFSKSICVRAAGTGKHDRAHMKGRFRASPGTRQMTAPAKSREKKAHSASRSTRPPETVYFTSAIGLLDDPLYGRALRKVRRLHAGATVLSAKALWSSAKDWLATYQSVLADVTHVYILPYEGSVVGAGIVEEVNYLDQRARGAPSVFVFDDMLNLRDLHGFLSLPNPTKGRFARLCAKSEFLRLRSENRLEVNL